MTRTLEVKACFVVRGKTSQGGTFLTREFIWPSCDCEAHRRYLNSLMQKKADRMNTAGATVTVQYQELSDDGLWKDAKVQNPDQQQ